VRYVDAPVVQADIHIEATPQRVWDLVIDIELPARLSPELQRVQWLDGASGPTVGARFMGYNHNPVLGEWRTTAQVTELNPLRVFAWAVTDPDGRFGASTTTGPMATWRFELTPQDGGTQLRQSVQIGPARSGLSLAIDRMPEEEAQLVAYRIRQLRAGMEATLAGTKSLAGTRQAAIRSSPSRRPATRTQFTRDAGSRS